MVADHEGRFRERLRRTGAKELTYPLRYGSNPDSPSRNETRARKKMSATTVLSIARLWQATCH